MLVVKKIRTLILTSSLITHTFQNWNFTFKEQLSAFSPFLDFGPSVIIFRYSRIRDFHLASLKSYWMLYYSCSSLASHVYLSHINTHKLEGEKRGECQRVVFSWFEQQQQQQQQHSWQTHYVQFREGCCCNILRKFVKFCFQSPSDCVDGKFESCKTSMPRAGHFKNK